MPRGKPHSRGTKNTALAMFAQGFSNAEVASRLGLPETTTIEWHKRWVNSPEFVELQLVHQAELVGMLKRLVHAAEVRLMEAIVQNKISPDRLPSTYSTLLDKLQLLSGQPNQRIETINQESDEDFEKMTYEMLVQVELNREEKENEED